MDLSTRHLGFDLPHPFVVGVCPLNQRLDAIKRSEDAVKAVMAGTDCIQMVSALLQHGPAYLKDILARFQEWMEENEYHSLAQMKGSMSYLRSPKPEAVERCNYMKILQSWQP